MAYPLVFQHSIENYLFIVDLPWKRLWFSIVRLLYQRVSWFSWALKPHPWPHLQLGMTSTRPSSTTPSPAFRGSPGVFSKRPVILVVSGGTIWVFFLVKSALPGHFPLKQFLCKYLVSGKSWSADAQYHWNTSAKQWENGGMFNRPSGCPSLSSWFGRDAAQMIDVS